MNKQGVVTARIEYANLTDESTQTTKPMNKNVSDELNNRNNGMFMFTEDFEFNPFPVRIQMMMYQVIRRNRI